MGEQETLENSRLIIRAAYESAKRDALEEMRSYAKEQMTPLLTLSYLDGYRRGRRHGILITGLFMFIVILWSVFLR